MPRPRIKRSYVFQDSSQRGVRDAVYVPKSVELTEAEKTRALEMMRRVKAERSGFVIVEPNYGRGQGLKIKRGSFDAEH